MEHLYHQEFMPGFRIGIVEIQNELLDIILWAKHSSDISTPGAILPGTYFLDKLIEDRFFRINIANPSIQDLEKGISIISDNIDDFLETYKDKLNNKSNKLFY